MTRSLLSAVVLAFVGPEGLHAEPPRSAPERLPPGAVARLGSARLRHISPVRALIFAPDGRTLYAAGGKEHLVRAWDTTDGHEVRRFVQEHSIYRLALTADGKTLVTDRGDHRLSVWDAIWNG